MIASGLSKREFLDICNRRGQRVSFVMPVDFEQLLFNRSGIERLNEMVDLFVEDGYLLEDINYTPVSIEKDNINIEVDAYAAEWLKTVPQLNGA